MHKGDDACEVNVHFQVKFREVDFLRLGEVELILDSSIEEDAVDVRRCECETINQYEIMHSRRI